MKLSFWIILLITFPAVTSAGVGEEVSGGFSLYLQRPFRLLAANIGESDSPEFALNLSPLSEGIGMSRGVPVHTRVQAGIRLSARVHEEYDIGQPRSLPLSGATVIIRYGGSLASGITDENGFVPLGITGLAGTNYEIELSGPAYNVRVWPVVTSSYEFTPRKDVSVDVLADTTVFVWPHEDEEEAWWHAPALQVAFYVERFRREFWENRIGWDWRLPEVLGRPNNAMGVRIFEHNNPLKSLGGASVSGQADSLLFLWHRGEEADVVYHEFTHAIIADRFVRPGRVDYP